MTEIVGRLRLDFGDWSDSGNGRIAILLEPITFGDITLPAGFMSDGATVPQPLWWFLPPWGDRATVAALFHDYACGLLDAATPVPRFDTRQKCDGLLYDVLIAAGVSLWRARIVWAGCRIASAARGQF